MPDTIELGDTTTDILRSAASLIDLGTVCCRWDYQAHQAAETTAVQQVRGTRGAHFRAKLDIDADGAPASYHPADVSPQDNTGRAYDWLDNLSSGDRHGIQGRDGAVGPANGFVISATTVEDRNYPVNDTRRYVDASSIPYVVLPKGSMPVPQAARVRDGCILFVIDTKTGGSTGAMFADVGRAVGEGSIRLAQRLGLKPFSRRHFPKVIGFNDHGDSKRFFFILFADVLVTPPWLADDIESKAWQAFQDWGGEPVLRSIVPDLPPLRRAQTVFDESPPKRSLGTDEYEPEPSSRGRSRDVPKRELDPDYIGEEAITARSVSPSPAAAPAMQGTFNPDVAPDPSKVELSTEERSRLPIDRSDPTAIDPRHRDAPEDLPPDDRAVVRARLPTVSWPPSDEDSPDYAHLLPDPQEPPIGDPTFEFGADELELLIAANGFVPAGCSNKIVFALRGARLTDGDVFETVDKIKLADVRPDHRAFRCTLGIYNRANRKMSAFRGSTVPNVEWMTNYYKKVHDIGEYRDLDSNILPTGCYVYRIATHRDIYTALRLTDPGNLSVDGKATVLRTSNDLTYTLEDTWDPCSPNDDIHCAYFDDHFSSAGCLTIQGKDGRGPWGRFQDVLKTMPRGSRLDAVLLTGRDAAIAAHIIKDNLSGDQALVRKRLGRLRAGSQGDSVNRLQEKLGLRPTGYFGPQTTKILADRQRAAHLPTDGIYGLRIDRQLNWGVLEPAQPVPVQPLPDTASSSLAPAGSLINAPAGASVTPAVQRSGTPAAAASEAAVGAVIPTLEQLRKFASRDAKPEYLQVMADQADTVLRNYAINANPTRFCHFMGQVGNECGGFSITHESLYYTTAQRICAVWPSRFPTLDSARPYLRNEQKLAEKVYFKRLGNDQPGDGFKYRGRGFIQITGRESYRVMGRKINADLEGNPELAIDPAIALKIAAQTWADKSLAGERDMNRLSELNKLEALTYRINGGFTNISDRRDNFAKAWRLWGQGSPPEGSGEPDTVERGDRGQLVSKLKSQLADLGYGQSSSDKTFGLKTYKALYKFQKEHALTPTGVAGPETWAALERAIAERSRMRSARAPAGNEGQSPTTPAESLPRLALRALSSIRNVSAILAAVAVIFAVAYLASLTQPQSLGSLSLWLPVIFAGLTFILSFMAWHWATGVPTGSENDARDTQRKARDAQMPARERTVEAEDDEPVRSGSPNLERP